MAVKLHSMRLPEGLKELGVDELKALAGEIREEIIRVTSKKGGHVASSLGAVELAVALHYCLNSPEDKIIWDVGHQSYAHKLLTGRAARFETLREMGGLSGFPNKDESSHDHFTLGHSATSISAALGMAKARDIKKEKYKVAAVIGDASLSTGLAFEGLNQAGHMGTSMVVVLNDNEHSISKPVGAMSKYLTSLMANPLYNKVKEETEKAVKGIPRLGPQAHKAIKKFNEGLKNLLVPGILFEELGFRYFGPIDGHDLGQLIAVMSRIFTLKEPVLLHTITRKGEGYRFARSNPVKFHGVSGYDEESGEIKKEGAKGEKHFTAFFGEKILELAGKNRDIVAITAAMTDGTGLVGFAEKFPDRFYDVGITEPHAVTFAAGLARGGLRPVVAIYSTFLQRGYDQLLHDIALQKLPVVFCLDRAGIVGKDGPTHHGVFDISFMKSLPGFVVMAPKDGRELEEMLEKALLWEVPVSIRYPRDIAGEIVPASSCAPLKLGLSEKLRKGKDAAVIAVGSMVNSCLKAADILSHESIEIEVINSRFIKPLDKEMIEETASSFRYIFTAEEGIADGGFGSAVLEFCERENIPTSKIKRIALPDEFIEHGSREELLRKYHLDPAGIAGMIRAEIRERHGK
ncbi:MAG TPA: 1-deoxy-D-xylulose-5-phosphate synthase [Candidatus Omnitrophota bacterium]|nr:1-deoxy-D-xylulose-5-phosphate synthase [Candidatus Omnitrophota bacterium]